MRHTTHLPTAADSHAMTTVRNVENEISSVARVARRGSASLVLGGLALALTSCSTEKKPQNTWAPSGKYARSIDHLQKPIFAVAGVVGLIVMAAVVYCIVKFRERPGHDSIPHQSHGNPKVEISLTALSAAILLVVAVPTVNTLFDISNRPKDTAFEVTVIGQQWWWEFQYKSPGMEGIVTATELVIPVGKKIRLSVTSRDVIHSFWIPKLNGKRDAVPNRVQPLNMEATTPGIYEGQCTEFCGLSHANMRQRVVALSEADFATWVANQLKPAAKPAKVKDATTGDLVDTAETRGEAAFIANCARCHQVAGLVDDKGEPQNSKADEQLVSGAAPNLTHLMSRSVFAGGKFDLKTKECAESTAPYVTGTPDKCLNRADLEAWLRNAPAVKPMYSIQNKDKLYRGMPNLNLSEAQIDDLVAYLVTLK
jgi:cytochrome c oxidase subunit II